MSSHRKCVRVSGTNKYPQLFHTEYISIEYYSRKYRYLGTST